MSKDKIARCVECHQVDFVDRDNRCEWCCETSELVYSTGMLTAATRVDANEPEAA